MKRVAGPGFQRPATAQAAVLAELRRAIISGDLRPGQQIVQDNLAAEWGVSRHPIREALRTLEAEGHIRHEAHRGYFVADLSPDDLREITRIRDVLEEEAIRQGVPRLTDGDVDRLDKLRIEVAEAAQQSDVSAMADANRRFHFAILESAAMPRLVRHIRILWDATDAYHPHYYLDEAHRDLVNDEHQEIVEAARARDADRLVRMLAEHRRHAIQAVIEALTAGDAADRR
jgi:DNA-binding GntR family transcriptional regulator